MNSTAYDLFHQAALLILTPKCFDNYFIDFNFTDGKLNVILKFYMCYIKIYFLAPCFSATLSKGLGIVLILGSLLVKVPQILKIFKSQSGTGINIFSVTLDLAAITIHMAYNFVKGFPFSSWGDTLFLAVQTVIIGALVLWYNKATIQSLLYLIIYLVVCYVLMGGLTPIDVLWSLTSVNIVIVVAGKGIQAWTNYKNGNTGQLAAVTLIMLMGGSLARIFTSIQETGDPIVIITYIASSAVNSLLVFQLVYYWNSNNNLEKKKKKKKQ